MGRSSTGAWTVHESKRIELSYLLRHGFIKKGETRTRSISWSDNQGRQTGSIMITSQYLTKEEGGAFIELDYTFTDRQGEKTDYRKWIRLFEQPSNLRKGSVLYFICPRTWRKCRILYQAYGSPVFMSREAYSYRLYYDCQKASKLGKWLDGYWRVDKHIKNLEAQGTAYKRSYKGQPTKAAFRYERLCQKRRYLDLMMWSKAAMPLCLRRDLKESKI